MIRAFLIIVSLVAAGMFVPASAADVIANVVAVAGNPTASGRKIAAKSEIFEHDKIVVGNGNAQILFVDGTKLVVGPGSTLVIEKYLMRANGNTDNFSINALRGTFRFITGKSAKKAYNIKTANATIGIRGTGFDYWVKDKTGVAVLEGSVRLCNLNKSCVDLEAGCQMGIAQSRDAEEVKLRLKAEGIQANLPYILDQSALNPGFRLNVSSCTKALKRINRLLGGNDDPKAPKDSPRPPPQRQQNNQ